MSLKSKLKRQAGINVSAMSDIAFLLLIFFILSSVTEEDKEIPIELPQSHISVQETEKFFNVWIDKDGDIYFGAKKGNPVKLTTFATYRLRKNPKVKALIRASRDVEYEAVDTVFDALREAGLHHIVLVSEKR